jgi:glutathione synthase
LRLAFVVNSVRTQKSTYTTLHIAFEAQLRGHEVHFVGVDDLTLSGSGANDTRVTARASRPVGRYETARRYTAALREPSCPTLELDLAGLDVLFLRNNPNLGEGPRDNPALDFARRVRRAGVLVLNDPDGLSRARSKMYLAGFPEEIRPRTLISRRVDEIKRFLASLDGPAVLKPLFGFGGQNVFFVERGETANLTQLIGAVRRDGHVIAQEYLPEVERGDKRVLLLGGAPLRSGGQVAAYKRMRPADDIRNNMHVGGRREPCDFSPSEQRICDLLRPRLVADGLSFVGVDLVGDKVLEINVFAPGGVHNIDELYGVNVGATIVDELERRVRSRSDAA